MSAIDWTTIQNALRAWVQAGSALDNVIWSYHGGPRPSAPYIAMSISSVATVGRDWVVYEEAEAPAENATLKRTARGMRTATLSLQCFGTDAQGDTASPLLADVIAHLELWAYDLDLAGVGLGSIGPIRLLEGRRGSILEPRALVEVELHLASEVFDYINDIGYVQLTSHVMEQDGVTEVESTEQWIPTEPPP